MAGWIVKRDGPCSKCGTLLRAGETAVWVRGANRMECLACPPLPIFDPSPPPVDSGVAGLSARREQHRRRAGLEADRKARWGNRVGGWVNRFAEEPQSIRAWAIGAKREELLGAALARVPGLIVLNDRKVKGTRGNVDHIAVAPAGVFVIDANQRSGFIEVVDKGSFFRSDLRLIIGGRNESKLAADMGWQLKAVTAALIEAGVDPLPPIAAVLCFIDPNWPLFRRPKSFDGVRIESEASIVKVLGEPAALPSAEIDRLAQVVAEALPAK